MTHDSPERLTPAQWAEWADVCRRDGRDDLARICLDNAACAAAEGEKTIAEMLMRSDG